MDSINRNQAEETHADLSSTQAIQKIRDLVETSRTCFFCTSLDAGPSSPSRPMGVEQIDDTGNLWFLSSSDSHKNQQLTNDSKVKLYFQGSSHSDFLELTGIATLSRDKAKIKELWKPIMKTWFTAGIDDPRITVIRFQPTDGYYWDTKHGPFVAGIKMMIGATLGRTMDDSIQGRLQV
jgi:general stress protein 26